MAAGRQIISRIGGLVFMWFLIAPLLCLAAIPGNVSPGDSWVVPREIVLQQQVASYDANRAYLPLDNTNTAIRKEPALGKAGIFHCVLPLGRDTNNAMALIWDQPKGDLYLDLNRNLDLTDDAAGVFHRANTGPQQNFNHVTLPLKTAEGLRPVIVDLQLTPEGAGQKIQALVTPRSMWQGKVGAPGNEWQVAVLDDLLNPNGPALSEFLLLRPWAERTNRLSLYDLTSGIVRFPHQLFWLGQSYHLDRRFETQNGTNLCKLELTPQQPPLVKLNVSGESLYYVVLHDTNGYTAIMREPQGEVAIPRGVYTASAVLLKKGPIQAIRTGFEPLEVKATTDTKLSLGGPLTNLVSLRRKGRKLQMDYQLRGADGGFYHLTQQDRGRPPEFAVYQGGKKAFSGKFEFG